jgi:hypothetical protein
MQRSAVRTSLPKASDRYALGKSGLQVSPICLGITTRETVKAAFDAGINFFFISNDLHWSLYAPLMAGVNDLLESGVRRDDIVICGVSYLSEPIFAYLQFNELLAAMPRLERVDVLLAGAAELGDFLPRYRSLHKARAEQLWQCRGIGASFHDRVAARVGICSDLIDIAYIRYNPGHPGAEEDLFPYIPTNRACLMYNFKSTSAYITESVFKRLQLTPDYKQPRITDSYRFALMRPEMDGLLVSPQTPQQVAELVRALELGPISANKARYMKNLWLLATGQASIESM